MDSATLAGWAVALGTLGLLWVTVRTHNTDMSAAKMKEQMKPIEDQLVTLKHYHEQHFQETKKNAQDIASLQQGLTDHIRHTQEAVQRMEDMHREIRDDIKELLKR